MSDRDMWMDRISFNRKTGEQIDPITHRRVNGFTKVLEDEPCDLVIHSRDVLDGVSMITVKRPECKIMPLNGLADCPDENDEVVVNGEKYAVETRNDYWDDGSGDYRGSRLVLTTPQATDTTAVRGV